ncbi:metalloregulator ArsR/SmtB family transcription factor [Amycolatopsis panacis]|uniref:ArsR family transcriptional regulator n=1 Tax=Amycolatopsis panacis TaxID=2340917 RepID=A0A419I6X2_9PSEU|nr:metalloregulator ArsR/SmtB family transcription factor [Amycolatopsis panacis]RJQ87411.1 ArsR family transcriptional regulator [Amycolatopsis panacis]
MERIAAALGDAARWRLVELLAERPRTVGELAELAGLRQPQATKHLQTLARAGLVAVFPLGQRRVYAAEAGPLEQLARRVREMVHAIAEQEGDRDVLSRYRAAIEAETVAAEGDRWADGRFFTFRRSLDASPEVVWRQWIEPERLARWWAPPSMTVAECVLEPWPGGRAVLEYRDGDGRYRSEGTVHSATEPAQLAFELSVLDATGAAFFTGHYDVTLTAVSGGTRLRLDLRITDLTVEAVPFIAGIETGWEQVLDNLAAVIGGTLGKEKK